MMQKKSYLAVDMGASSGRHVVGYFDGTHLELEEVYRFENGPTEMLGSYYWDLPGLWSHVRKGLASASEKTGRNLESVGVDTWGVDFLLVGQKGEFLGMPYSYRDPRTDGVMERACQKVSRKDIFQQTGLQFMQINTLFQLIAMREADSPFFESAARFLMMPDLFHWLLSGEMSNEFTDSTTTQCFDPVSQSWAFDLLKRFGIPEHLFHPVCMPGTVLGGLRSTLAAETGFSATKVVLPGSHDTASAVLAVPASGNVGAGNWAYISLGTWALMGVETRQPIINETVAGFNFTNEGGVASTTRLLKNICGLWLIQECRREWNAKGVKNSSGLPLDWDDIREMAVAVKPWQTFINPDARDFLSPTDMPEAIRNFARRTGQTIPETPGAIARTAIDSLAMRFRQVLEMCRQITGKTIDTIHIVGGGTRNTLLCQLAADATGCRIVAGPIEATAIGNIMQQAVAAGDVSGIEDARRIIRDSFDVVEYFPRHSTQTEEAYGRFLSVTDQ